jgi:hypothetical protein
MWEASTWRPPHTEIGVAKWRSVPFSFPSQNSLSIRWTSNSTLDQQGHTSKEERPSPHLLALPRELTQIEELPDGHAPRTEKHIVTRWLGLVG